ATTLEARLGQGAFLALRLVDLLASDHAPASVDAFHYQWVATDRFCRELRAAATEGAHVHGIASSDADAPRLGDVQLIGPARIGRANTVLGRGNIAEAERRLQGILADARVAGAQDAEARAEHGIAVALHHMGQAAEAIPHAWRAFELYEEDDSRMRALNDVGIMLLSLGDAVGAERALAEVVRRGGGRESTSNALV